MVTGDGINGQLWLTYVLNDKQAVEALTLCSSLKRLLTSRKVGVIASRKVSNHLREALHYSFDLLFPLEEEWNTVGLKGEDFVKLIPLTLKPYEKCVVLAPSMLAVQNCDKIFDGHNKQLANCGFVWTREEGSSIFLVQPSLKIFKVLMKEVHKGNGKGVEVYLKTWTKNQGDNGLYAYLDNEKYGHVLSSKSGIGGELDAAIVNMMDIPSDAKLDEFGLYANLILKHRKLIHEETVEPLLKLTSEMFFDDNIDTNRYEQEPIAIVGMSCRYPKANNLDEFWELLVGGKDGTGTAPDCRWTANLSWRKDPHYRQTNAGFLNTPVEEFDSKFFGISPLEMEYLDPQARLLHELVWEGLEDAAVNPHKLRGTNGSVFIGSWTNDYKEILIQGGSGPNEFYRRYMGNSIGASAARISSLLGITGPSIATESGCSSAMVAVHLACRSLRLRETNFALACGVNLLLHPFDENEMPMILSPEGCCKTFDAKADGFARAEGCGVLVLKRLSDAVRDGDKIWAMIRGSGMSQEGVSKSMGTPTVQCESLAMKKALRDAGVKPEQVSYVEAHGTGTRVGDPMEVAAVAKAYHSKNRKEPLLIGSVKTNVGHTEACAGIVGMMKVILAMQHEIIPPHRNFDTLNPDIDLDSVPATIPLEPVEWKRMKGKPRFAGVSSFGITGTDAHAILEEAPIIHPTPFRCDGSMERPLHFLKISAKTEDALTLLQNKYFDYLNKTENDFKNVSFTANIGRADFSHRAIIIAKSNEDAIKSIEENKIVRGEVSSNDSVGKVCFLFTGQGSQYPGMGKQLYETNPVFRMHFEYCEKILKSQYNIDIAKILWSEVNTNEVSRTIYSQTSIFCVEYALLKLWESWGVKPDYALGHSLGEFAAAVCAGILTVEDALKLVAERSWLIDQLPRGKMLVIKAEKQRVDSLMNKFAGSDKTKMLDYAAINSAEQTVVAGDADVVLEFLTCCKNANLKCILLEATHAFHSKHMDPMLDSYRTVAKTITRLSGNLCEYISGMKGTLFEANQLDAEYWVEHTRQKVNFLDASQKAVELGCKTFIEIGPQPVLSALTMMNNEQPLICLPSLKRNQNEWETLLNTLAKLYTTGLEINWNGFDMFYEREKVPLPHYPFVGKRFWPDLTSTTGSAIHPLLGSFLPNPSSSKLFESVLSLRSLEYVKDHCLGDNIIFPGAGYLEMCMAAGSATVEGIAEGSIPTPTRPMKVENLMFEAPLPLIESVSCQVQTVVEFSTPSQEEEKQHQHQHWNELKVSIFRKLETSDSSKWLRHATSQFCPVVNPEEVSAASGVLDKSVFTSILSTPCDENWTPETYKRVATTGLRFGPEFRTLGPVWRDVVAKGTMLFKVVANPTDNHHIVHPLIMDAMAQAAMMLHLHSTSTKKMYVPIRIGKFLWLSPINSTTSMPLYIYAYTEPNSSFGSALLLDSSGNVMALMSCVEFIGTTVKVIDSILEQQSSAMPDLWEEVWRPQLGPAQNRVHLSKTIVNYRDLNIVPDDYNFPPPHLTQIFEQIETLVYLNMLHSLYECGWKPILGQKFEQEKLRLELGILHSYHQYFGFILLTLQTEGILEKEGKHEGVWQVQRMPPSQEAVESILASSTFNSDLRSRYTTTPLFTKVGENLGKILTGKQQPLNILFPEEKEGYPSVSHFYTTYEQLFQLRNGCVPKSVKRFRHIRNQMEDKKFVLRVLEVGAGTGSYTENLLTMLEEGGVDFEYTYTDISASFFSAAEKRFEKHLKSFTFKKLNIEEDPVDQGFTPEYYDLVCASDVIHTTKSIQESLSNMRSLLKPNGLLDIQEMTRVHRFVTFLFGLLDGFWRFEDVELRPNHCTISQEEWVKVLNSSGFEVDGNFPMMNGYHSYIWGRRTDIDTPSYLTLPLPTPDKKCWLIFTDGNNSKIYNALHERFATTTRRVITVLPGTNFENNNHSLFRIRKDVEADFVSLFNSLNSLEGIIYCWAMDTKEVSQEEILRPYFYLTKSLLLSGSTARLISLTRGLLPIREGLEDLSTINYNTSTILGFTRSLKNENNDMAIKMLDVEQQEELTENHFDEIFWELWNFDKEILIGYRDSTRYFPKLQPHKPTTSALKLPPGSDRFQLILPESRSISDLQFGSLEQPQCLGENEVEVQIKASALNFRDVLSVIKPSEEFKDINTVGFDFAGVIKRVGENVTMWKAGDRVCGCNIHFTALPSHVTLNEELLLQLPDVMSFCEAATMPAVYITSVLCLVDIAKIKKGDVVLIHTASGGVGLSAIEICKHVGCTIIATAGSKRKQNYLRGLGIQHIFHSRNTKYGDQILELTNGRGVDVVLNSLTSEGFKETTLKACAKGARFVEMSKLNIWTEEEVKALRPDVKYTVIDVSASDENEWKQLLKSLKGLQMKGVVKPIPYTGFDALNIREALQYMQKAKHIGKVVCVMPELRNEEGEMKVNTPMFNDRGTYLITGGLGGIGFVVCEWMISRGAKYVVLASRRPPSLSTQNKIDKSNSKGAHILPVQLDVGNFLACESLLNSILPGMNLPPLKGVMHAAGTIADGLVVNQNWENLRSTFAAKIDGTLNLHNLTKSLDLEHFVVFSSIASLFGNPGQSNHSAGNCFEDALIHHRNSCGLPGTTINWGQWGEVGVATEVDLPGLKTLSNVQGITGLEYAMKKVRAQTAIFNVNSCAMLSKLFPHLAVYLDERIWKKGGQPIGCSSLTIKSDEFWQQYDSHAEPDEKLEVVKIQLRSILRNTLKLDDSDPIKDEVDIQEMGVDSLMLVEIRNGLQSLFGERLQVNASALKNSNTINLMTCSLVNLIEGGKIIDTKPTMEEVKKLMREDCELPQHIQAKPGQMAVDIKDVHTVLLTGCSGALGPYILKELTALPQITKVICLMRPLRKVTGEERLTNILRGVELLPQVDMKKVRCVTGNVAEPHMGMEPKIWKQLSEEVDGVFHCAASVQHTEFYKKRESKSDMRAVNVGGTKNVLEFACENKLKHVFHASTLLAVVTVDEKGRVSENWPEIGDYDDLVVFAYPITKFVGDVLMKQAVERGIPCKVFRFPFIVGDSVQGRCSIEKNHAMLRYFFIMKNGMMPFTPTLLHMLPVDFCADVSVRIFFEPEAGPNIYNLNHGQPDADQEFVNVAAKLGYEVDLVEYSEFAKRVKESEGSALDMFKDFYEDEDAVIGVYSSAPILRKWVDEGGHNNDMWWSDKVTRFVPNFFDVQKSTMHYVYKDLLFCKSQGWFQHFGLK